MKDAEWRFYSHVLDRLEELEFPLLSWGVTDGALSEQELLESVEDALLSHADPPESTPGQVVATLLNTGLVFRVPFESQARYRTRFAEALRLTSQLRQLFPYHLGRDWARPETGWWQRGPRLVADYRLHAARRRYPRRNILPQQAMSEFSGLRGWGPRHSKVATALMNGFSLSRFQVDATKAIHSALIQRKSSGVIIGAGTGSGKTLSFYLPALTAMAAASHPGSSSSVHTLALYPRNELLRDQLRDALANAERVEGSLRDDGSRPLRIGVLYGDTPENAQSVTTSYMSRAWKRRSNGYLCPYLTCPSCTFGELLWPDFLRNDSQEGLECQNQECRRSIPGTRLALTRESLKKNAPDLLFTTNEMLNKHSMSPKLGKLLGWTGGGKKPTLVLLDEVHTYTGVHGAQTALLLRRWRNAVRQPVIFAGLSATLKDAQWFFSQLTGLEEADVTYIEPHLQDIEEEGREYALALRGDPLSGTPLLSTSIQTAMLFGRVLDPLGGEGLYGSTGFLFTDDLDVTNRYFRIMREAEGKGRSGKGRHVLANLRAAGADHRAQRFPDGQSWDLIEKIGPGLSTDLVRGGLSIGRTSSQDSGVDLNAKLTVATASLEVGFNDPRVGLVLQHRAPHNASSFIQRRGRAGRQRRTRPITIVTLSDYGRDRLTYQAYESLFAPQVTATSLPIHNRYVLKIQAAQVLLDWLQQKLNSLSWNPGYVKEILKASASPRTKGVPEVIQLLKCLLENSPGGSSDQDRLARYLQDALKISPDEAQALMWEQPRSLMLSVVPTALRRLETSWKPLRTDPGAVPGSMLPEFVTPTLFTPLNLPEVTFELPFGDRNAEESMPIARALREAVPGRVSRRYGYLDDDDRTWLPLPDRGSDVDLESSFLQEHEIEGNWSGDNNPDEVYTVIRPHRIKLELPPPDIEDRSQSIPLWASAISEASGVADGTMDPAGVSSWLKDVRIGFRTHAGGNPVTVRRMVYGADATCARRSGEARISVRYTYQEKPAALGFELLVDAFKVVAPGIDLSLPNVQGYLRSPQWRTCAFLHAVEESPGLTEITNVFKRRWLARVYFTALSLQTLEKSMAVPEAWGALSDGSWREETARILQILYRADESSVEQLSDSRLAKDLNELSKQQAVLDALNSAGELLFSEEIAERTCGLARRAYRDTLAAAVLSATLRLCPEAQESDVILDVIPSQDPGGLETIWLSETSIGGLGVIEKLATVYGDAPQRFWSTVTGTLKPNEYEYVDATLTRLLQDIVDDPSGAAATAVQEMRASSSLAEAEEALRALRSAWTEIDGPPRHHAVATLSTRVLRPGSSPETDSEALDLLSAWVDVEQRLGFEVDAGVIAYAVGTETLSIGARGISADQAFSMMWPRGAQARNHHLQHYQPYLPLNKPSVLDRLLVETALDECLPKVDVTQKDWKEEYERSLATAGALDLVCPAHERMALSEALSTVPLIAVDRDVLRLFGEIEGVSRNRDLILVRVILREVEQ